MSIGKRIKDLRKKYNISQVDLATTIGVSKQTMYKYENDIVANIPSDKIELMAKAFFITPSYLMGWTKEKIQMRHHLSIDIETKSSIDIQKAGLYKYAQSPDFEVLLFAYQWDEDPVELVDLTAGEEIPEWVLDELVKQSKALQGL